MINKIIILFILVSTWQINAEIVPSKQNAQSNDVIGVLIEVESNLVQKQVEFVLLTNHFKLEAKRYFQNLRVLSLISTNKMPSSNKLTEFCSEVLKIKGVTRCELDLRLSPNSETGSIPCTSNLTLPIELPKGLNQIVNKISCELISKKLAPHKIENLSIFWAQEYTGADLAREEIIARGYILQIPENFLSIWDTGFGGNHAEPVAQLISGPNPSALIPQGNHLPFTEIDFPSGALDAYEDNSKKCVKEENCPFFINNSMKWRNSKIISNAVREISKKTVFVTGAGNDGLLMEEAKNQLALNGQIITVGSLATNGLASTFTSYSPDLTISAPSNNEITSYVGNNPVQFAGTSAAAPQVTTALAAFSLITGKRLTTEEAKTILEKTAIKFAYYPDRSSLGNGMLNSYKITELAFKISKVCDSFPEKDICIASQLTNDEIYSFKNDSTVLLDKAQLAFPECFNSLLKEENLTCDDKKDLFKKIRKAAFLNPQEPALWKVISCVNLSEGMTKNAEFYSALEKRMSSDDNSLVEVLLQSQHPYHLTKYILSNPKWKDTAYKTSIIEKLLKKRNADKDIVNDLLSKPEWSKRKDWINEIISRGKADGEIIKIILTQPEWSNRIDAIEKIVKRGKADSELLCNIFSQPKWSNRNDLVEEIVNRGQSDQAVGSCIVNNAQQWENRSDFVEQLIKRGQADYWVIKYIMRNKHWEKYPQLVDEIIKNNNFIVYALASSNPDEYFKFVEQLVAKKNSSIDNVITSNVLSQNQWQLFFKKRLGLSPSDQVTVEKIRSEKH